jgi:peptidoglycan/LPS O-acetylase OafA/YrhL
MSPEIHNASQSMRTPQAIDNTDWLKTAAIILVVVDHIGYFFIEDAEWWSVVGRLAAPLFFFLLGYAQTRSVPFRWIWLGVILTLLDSWNADWAWVAPNILLSFALIRIARPYAKIFIQHSGWVAFAVLIFALFAVLPFAAVIVEYGAEGWLWGLFGLCQRMYVDSRPANNTDSTAQDQATPTQIFTPNIGLMRLLACFIAAVVYVWQEQIEFSFLHDQLAAVIFGIGVLSFSLCLFRRGPSRIQPSEPLAGTMRFIGRHTLEIYAAQLAGSELLINLMPNLAG